MKNLIKPLQPLEIFLQPGEYYFGDRDTRIRTLLGSCVSLTFWHPKLMVGGMCHFMLPKRGTRKTLEHASLNELDGRYADEVMILLMNEISLLGTNKKDYQVKLFGGGNMFPRVGKDATTQIGHKNVLEGQRLIKHHGFNLVAEHIGDEGHRNVAFDVWSGEVWVKHMKLANHQGGGNE
jgi:chemotaxis protein CheD